MATLKHVIGGERITPTANQWEDVINPATGEMLGTVPLDDTHALDRAVQRAAEAFEAWATTPILQRARIMFKFHDLMTRNQADIARSVTIEHGKTLPDASLEVARAIEVVELAASAPSLLKGEVLPDVSRGVDTMMVRTPLGVVAGITPFNFPAMVPLWMIPPALVSGNTFVLKPSEKTPLTSLLMMELWEEAGLPPGVLNVVLGGRSTVDQILTHPTIKAVSFVGSQPVAEYIYRTAAAAGKRVQALGGAKNYHIVMPDAHIPRTVEALMGSAFGSAGERCLAGSVAIAVGSAAERLIPTLRQAIRDWKVGSGLDETNDMGPVIREQSRERISHFIRTGVEEGAALLEDGRENPVAAEGFFLRPTLFDEVTSTMTIAREEIFGPVLSLMRAPDLKTAVDMANQSQFGNTATIYTESGAAARYFRDHIEVGMVGVNIGVPAPVAIFPFAGWKHSFYGDLHATGMDAFRFYTEEKVVISRFWGTEQP
ncbi:methylmalonate-semialdehyde dehydrogenase (CoA acylating) [Sulfobacillus thermotolerans]|uniref:methylmalonate-semialdehyde dehydrogenase (CoA acylating) n=1 Tax=Sulfobacillus thermotolerans TaxID=338644 RepID=A0ABM6RRC7_9FIRM|nr:methylmalonate-semialdehyde dehydrogenase (CoA acylating) [Sulfobacillus thermotolerans]